MFAIGGTVLFVGAPAFFRNLNASRLVEAMDGLERMSVRAAANAEGKPVKGAYPGKVGWTPAEVAGSDPKLDAPGAWDHPTWKALEFGFDRPHFYSFAFESKVEGKVASYRARARGDLDDDSQFSDFSIRGSYEGGKAHTFHLEMSREIE